MHNVKRHYVILHNVKYHKNKIDFIGVGSKVGNKRNPSKLDGVPFKEKSYIVMVMLEFREKFRFENQTNPQH